MSSTCNFCGATGLTWHENLGCYVSEVTGRRHGFNICLIKVPRFEFSKEARVICIRKADNVAAEIVKRCMSAGINPNKVRTAVEGEFVIIKR